MKLYKNTTTNEVFAFESDGSQDNLITPGMVKMTRSEIDAHTNPPPVPPTPAQELTATDAGMIRAVEDLTDTLIAKGLITSADLPAFTVSKLDKRKALRALL